MEVTEQPQEKKYIPVIQAATTLGATSDAVVGLCKAGTLQCREVNGVWFVDPASLTAYKKEYPRDDTPRSQSQGSNFTYFSESDHPLIPETKAPTIQEQKALPPSTVVSTFVHKGVAVAAACLVVLGSLYISDTDRLGRVAAYVTGSVSGKTALVGNVSSEAFTRIDALLLPVARVVEETHVVIDSALYDIDRFGYFMLEHFRTDVAALPHEVLYAIGAGIVIPTEHALAVVREENPYERFINFGEDVYALSDEAAHLTADILGSFFLLPKETLAMYKQTLGRLGDGMHVVGDTIITAEEAFVMNITANTYAGLEVVHNYMIARPADGIAYVGAYLQGVVGNAGESFGKALGIHRDSQGR